MPWTPEDAPKHKKGLTAKQRRQWADVANSSLKRCMDDGGTEASCAASAIRQANGVAGNEALQVHTVITNDFTIRTEMHQGRTHIVVPAIMMVEGVHAGSHGPLLHPASELGQFPGAWDGIPVVVHHPEIDGVNVSANSPGIAENETVGRVYNTEMDGAKLRSELWLDQARLASISPEALEMIQKGEKLEVSVGVFTVDEMTPGTWNGEQYIGVARSHRPDHLALLPDGRGACSFQDGCGIRANQAAADPDGDDPQDDACQSKDKDKKKKKRDLSNQTTQKGGETNLPVDKTPADKPLEPTGTAEPEPEEELVTQKKMTRQSINDLPDSAFAYIEPGGTKDAEGKTVPRSLRHFPIQDAAHARNALARAPQSPFGAKAMKKILAACKKFGIEVSNHQATDIVDLAVDEAIESLDATAKVLPLHGYLLVQGDQGYRAKMEAIQTKLDRMDDDVKVHFLQDVYDNYFIYEVRGRMGGTYSGAGLYKRNYRTNNSGDVEFTGEPAAVRREVRYVNANEEGGTMPEEKKPCCPAKVKALIDNEHTPWQEADNEWLSGLDEAHIDKLTVQAEALAKEPEPKPEPNDALTKEQVVEALREHAKTPSEYIKLAPAEMQDVLTNAYNLHQKERTRLVDTIKKGSRFSDADLQVKTMAELEILADMVKPKQDYSAAAGGEGLNANASKAGEVLLPAGVEPAKEGGK